MHEYCTCRTVLSERNWSGIPTEKHNIFQKVTSFLNSLTKLCQTSKGLHEGSREEVSIDLYNLSSKTSSHTELYIICKHNWLLVQKQQLYVNEQLQWIKKIFISTTMKNYLTFWYSICTTQIWNVKAILLCQNISYHFP